MFSEKLERIIRSSGLNPRPGYYSGRGPTTSDLNTRILTEIHRGIASHFGRDPGEAFVDMVAAIESLSATTFLLTLAALEGSEFVWSKSLLGKPSAYPDGPGSAIGTLFAAFGRGQYDETPVIRNGFLHRNGRPVPPTIYGSR